MPPPTSDSRRPARCGVYGKVATHLALLSDRRLGEMVAGTTPGSSGVGGRCSELDVEGTLVFVKRVPLTDLEAKPEHARSTANLFGLPLYYQYGVGSAGFGAWRELAVHVMTTSWVLSGELEGFPLMYHWRVLPDSPPNGFMDFLGGIDGAVAHWDGSPAVRERLEAIGCASRSLVLFLEHIPQTLGTWLREQPDDDGAAYRRAEEALARTTALMSARGLVHFDAHFRNLLTDGQVIYFADFGLALSSRFELSAAERQFLAVHRDYDRHYVPGHLVRHHVIERLRGGTEAETFLVEWIAGRRPDGVPPELAGIVDRHAQTALIMETFRRRLLMEGKRSPYPGAELDQAAKGLAGGQQGREGCGRGGRGEGAVE